LAVRVSAVPNGTLTVETEKVMDDGVGPPPPPPPADPPPQPKKLRSKQNPQASARLVTNRLRQRWAVRRRRKNSVRANDTGSGQMMRGGE